MSRGKTGPRQVFGRSLALMLAGVLNGVAAAPVPVEESRPMGHSAGSQAVVSKISDKPVMVSSSVGPSGERDGAHYNGTAHLLNTIDQLRQEMMEMRGQLEEYAFRIEQLQQENRDRYLDLDERISRLNGQPQGKTPDVKPPMVNIPVMDTAEKQDQSVAKAEEAAYQSAFSFIRSKQFDGAKKALQQQLITYPEGRYADNARYWLGEVDMAQGRYEDARKSFQMILSDFPKSPKVPDASYKLGRVYDLLGNQKKARELLESVIQQYPDSAAARLSDTYLRTMGGS